ncbi:hypothetical protein Hanom_Chr06g00506491 [Helianthus anomalus]
MIRLRRFIVAFLIPLECFKHAARRNDDKVQTIQKINSVSNIKFVSIQYFFLSTF